MRRADFAQYVLAGRDFSGSIRPAEPNRACGPSGTRAGPKVHPGARSHEQDIVPEIGGMLRRPRRPGGAGQPDPPVEEPVYLSDQAQAPLVVVRPHLVQFVDEDHAAPTCADKTLHALHRARFACAGAVHDPVAHCEFQDREAEPVRENRHDVCLAGAGGADQQCVRAWAQPGDARALELDRCEAGQDAQRSFL